MRNSFYFFFWKSAQHEWLVESYNLTVTQGSTVNISCNVSNLDEDDVMEWTSHNPDMTLFFNQHKIAGTPDRYILSNRATTDTLWSFPMLNREIAGSLNAKFGVGRQSL